MQDLDLTIEELLSIDDHRDFKKFLYSLHEEVGIKDVSDLFYFYYDVDWLKHCRVIIDFQIKEGL